LRIAPRSGSHGKYRYPRWSGPLRDGVVATRVRILKQVLLSPGAQNHIAVIEHVLINSIEGADLGKLLELVDLDKVFRGIDPLFLPRRGAGGQEHQGGQGCINFHDSSNRV
jgi:hypothetical protein